ncbi:MAG: RNA 2'-phosphotransferase [Kofleriaceae bacterium]
MSNQKQKSKFLSLVLRHEPERIGITLDPSGWTPVDALLAAFANHGQPLTRAELDELVATSDKKRFALSDDGTMIRANQGHSVEVDLDLPPATPPSRLFHGTVAQFLPSIQGKGLIKGERHHVHLSADLDTAKKVGGRRGKPEILIVHADDMVAAGHTFFVSDNGVWLTDHVPAEFIEFPTPHGAGSGNRGAKVKIAQESLAACERGFYEVSGARVALTEAIDAAKAGTVLIEAARPVAFTPRATTIEVSGESTVQAMVRLAGEGHVACLNFASAKNPGGGFLGGAQAQEESLARASALYPCLVTQMSHYERNRANKSMLYLDLAIWSPHVPFFRDDDGGWLPAPVLASVITSAAPNAGALNRGETIEQVRATLERRCELVFSIAAEHGVDAFVLGAWGAGVFKNDPWMVAQIMKALLAGTYKGAFAKVVFAVINPAHENHRAFAETFSH